VRDKPEKMAQAFKDICTKDDQFLNSIERTTKSLDATRYRLTAWHQALGNAYGHSIPAPAVGASN
jgi:hypothetical protein